MPGFEVFNNSGSVLINSDQKHTIYHSAFNIQVGAVGDYELNTPFGNLHSLGYANDATNRSDGYLHWIQFMSNGAWAFPGSGLFLPGTARVIRTSRNMQFPSGVLDVFDGSGQLIWSAVGAASMPRVTGFLEVAGNYPLEGNVVSASPGYNPFFLWESCMGQMSYDGVAAGYSGNLMRWTGSQLQTTWIRRNQRGFNDIFNGRGNMKIPMAKFLGWN